MEELSFQVIILLIAFGFLAAFIDSVVGGGGLISLPALMFVGLSPASAIATNKLAATMGTFTSAMYFIRSGKVDFKIVGKLIPLTIVGAVAGALVVKFIPPDILRPLVLVMLVFIAIYIIAKKNWGSVSTYKKMTQRKTLIFFFAILMIGFYDGFFGPGTGTFLIIAFTAILGFDLKTACGNTKIVNLTTNIAALVVFIQAGQVYYQVALPAAVFSIMGNWLGSGLAIKKGAKFIKPVMVIVLCVLLCKLIFDFVA